MSHTIQNIDDVLSFINRAAAYYGWTVVGDTHFLETIAGGLLKNYRRYGFLQCPCRDSWGTREKDRDIMCPCSYCAVDIEEYGQCFCGLFLSKEFAQSGLFPSSIPERRPEEFFPY